MLDLEALGWTAPLALAFEPWARQGLSPGRVAAEHKHIYRVYVEAGELLARVSGRLRHAAEGRGDFPVTGDWVAVSPRREERRATIHGVLPRKSRFSRKVAGAGTEEQVLAANVDSVLLLAGLDGDYNVRRVERALVLAWESGADPVVVLNKADLCEDVAGRVAEIESIAPGVPVHAVSSLRVQGLEVLSRYLQKGRTVALLGSSGVGKSTLINRLLGRDVLRTREVRARDDRGRHTTTHRELFLLPGGGLVIDTPGMRELQLWAESDGLAGAFEDVSSLAAACAFRDCGHEAEPGCAVRSAVEAGRLSAERLESHQKLQRELRHLELRQDQWARIEEKRKNRTIHKAVRDFKPRG